MGVPGDHRHSDTFYYTQGVWYIFCMLGDQRDIFKASRFPQEPGMLPEGLGTKCPRQIPGERSSSESTATGHNNPFLSAPLGKQSLSHLFGAPFPWSFCQQFQANGTGKNKEKP